MQKEFSIPVFQHLYTNYHVFEIYTVPCISLASEDSLHEGLRWHPFDWEHGTTTLPVIAGSGGDQIWIFAHFSPIIMSLEMSKCILSLVLRTTVLCL